MKAGYDAFRGGTSRTEGSTLINRSPSDVFISVHPQHVNNILNGTKTVEFRRRFPSADRIADALVWLYSSSPVKAVVGVARVEGVEHMPIGKLWATYCTRGGVDKSTFSDYFSGAVKGFAIRLRDITSLVPRIPQSSLRQVGFYVPQSYRYVTDDVYPLLQDAYGETPTRHEHRDCP